MTRNLTTRSESFGDLGLEEYQRLVGPRPKRSRTKLVVATSFAGVLGVLGGLLAAGPGTRAWQPVDPLRESRTFEEAKAFVEHPVDDLQFEQGLHRILALMREGIALEARIARERSDRLGVQSTVGLGNLARMIAAELEALERETTHGDYARRKLDQLRRGERTR